MANGKLIWTPSTFHSWDTSDENRYLVLQDPGGVFNPGTSDFTFEFLYYGLSTGVIVWQSLISKADADLDNDIGYQIRWNKTSERIYVYMNDGNANQKVCFGSADAALDDTWNYIVVNFFVFC